MKTLIEGTTMENTENYEDEGPNCDCVHCPKWCEYNVVTNCWRDGD
jgi:hypothetical protein